MAVPFPSLIPHTVPASVPEVLVHLLTGSIADTTGKINAATEIFPGKRVYNSLDDTIAADFAGVFPIQRPSGVAKSVIALTGVTVHVGGGSSTLNENFGQCNVVIDWVTQTVTGVFLYQHGAEAEHTQVRKLAGSFVGATDETPVTVVGEAVDTIELAEVGVGSDPEIVFGTDALLALPMFQRQDHPHQFVATLTHYRSSDISDIEPMFPTFPIVTALPVEDQQPETIYILANVDDFQLAPPGLYIWGTDHWVCLRSLAPYGLPEWTGDVVVTTLIPGADYLVTIGNAEVTSVTLGLIGNGLVYLMGTNVYASTMPADVVGCGGIGATPFAGWTGANPYWRLEVQRFNGVSYARVDQLTPPA